MRFQQKEGGEIQHKRNSTTAAGDDHTQCMGSNADEPIGRKDRPSADSQQAYEGFILIFMKLNLTNNLDEVGRASRWLSGKIHLTVRETQGTWVQLGQKDPLEQENDTILQCSCSGTVSWAEELWRATGPWLQRVGYNRSDLHTFGVRHSKPIPLEPP